MSSKGSKEDIKTFDKLKQFFRLQKSNPGAYKHREDYVLTPELEKELCSECPVSSRVKALRELSETVLKCRLEEDAVGRLWCLLEDLLSSGVSKEHRHSVFAFYRHLIHGQWDKLGIMRAHIFKTIKDHDLAEDLGQRLELLQCLTDNGKVVTYFEDEIGPFLSDLMGPCILAEKQIDLLGILINVIKYHASYIDEDIMATIVKSTCVLCLKSTDERIVLQCLHVFDAVVCYSELPVESLPTFISTLCRAVNLEIYCPPSWKIMKNLLGTHLGYSSLCTMMAILRSNTSLKDPGLLRGAVFYINMALWSSSKIEKLKITPMAVLPSFIYESSIARLIKHYSIKISPIYDDWLTKLNELLARFYNRESRSFVRLRVLSLLSETVTSYRYNFGKPLVKIVVDHLADAPNETDMSVRVTATKLLVDVFLHSEPNQVTVVAAILKRILNRASDQKVKLREEDAEDIKIAAHGLIQVFTCTMYHSNPSSAIEAFLMMTSHLDNHYEQPEYMKQVSSVRHMSKKSNLCVNALTICTLEMREAMIRLLPEVLLNLSKISATKYIAIPILEFLSTLTQLPDLFTNFVQDQYMSVFAISLPYTNPFKYHHYTVSLAHHVIASWFLKCRLPFRKDFVKFITRGLKSNILVPFEEGRMMVREEIVNEDSSNRKRSSSLTEQGNRRKHQSNISRPAPPPINTIQMSFHKELTETCIDLMAMYTYSTCSPVPKRRSTADLVLNGGRSMTWLLGHKLITVTTSGCNLKALKQGLCDRCHKICHVEPHLLPDEEGTGRNRNPVRRSNSSPEMSSSWKNPLLNSMDSLEAELGGDSTKKKQNYSKDMRANCEAIPEEVGTTPPSDAVLLQPQAVELEPARSQDYLAAPPEPPKEADSRGPADPASLPPLAFKRDRGHTISVMSPARKPGGGRGDWDHLAGAKSQGSSSSTVSSTSSSKKEAPRPTAGVNPSFVFLQLYHSACFGCPHEKPILLNSNNHANAIRNLNWIPPYEAHRVSTTNLREISLLVASCCCCSIPFCRSACCTSDLAKSALKLTF
ncbi:unnamed protein product [Nesidiocoris tenuis]|uniref:Tuberin-type domain-containing protein n=1 Tax=Nesidiocoris tenuis TaxID=355587 RepID=A0A6H5G489_9HEMI|nr:unnamed protein product [Nesidiocoris tenuis]